MEESDATPRTAIDRSCTARHRRLPQHRQHVPAVRARPRTHPGLSCWRHLAATAEQIAVWAYHTFNADLDQLETNRARPGGEIDFLIACVYRLLSLRSLSTGDVLAITTSGQTTWLACDPIGWRPIDTPTTLTGGPLTARTIYHRIRPTP